MKGRARFLLTTAIASVFGACVHASQAASARLAPADDESDIVAPGPGCCIREEQSFRADEANPHGASVQSRLLALGTLRCTLKYVDGTTSQVEIQSDDPQQVLFRDVQRRSESCMPCFSELQVQARVSVKSIDGRVALVGATTLRELEPDDGYVFELSHGDVRAHGVLHARQADLHVVRSLPDGNEQPVAEVLAPCSAAATAVAP